MRSLPDVLIIGGGVIGLTTAFDLVREGAKVHVVDTSAPGSEASWAGAGIIPPGNPAGAATPYDRLRAESSRMFPALSGELREQTGIDNGYSICGGIEIFDRPSSSVINVWRAEGIDFAAIASNELRPLEPQLRLSAAEVYHLPGMAQVRNPWHLRALVATCQRRGVTVEPNVPVAQLRTTGRRVVSAMTESGRELAAGRFLIASGAWSDRLLGPLGLRTGVHPVLGQIVLLNPPKPLLRRIVCFEKRYLVPRDDGRILVGSTEEPEAGFDKRTTSSGVSNLVRFATEIVPALAPLTPEKTWAGLRPGSPDGMPYLGPIPRWDNAFVATGHYRAGIQLSPATGRIMTDLLMGRPPFLSIEAFRPDRPPGPPVPTAFRS
jgi:glycine oxidase